MSRTPLLITLDVERDYGPDWTTPDCLSFRSILEALPDRLAPIFDRYGIRPTYYLSPEVLLDRACAEVLESQENAELATHLHGEYLPPKATPLSWTDTALRILDMQCEYPPELERAKIQTLSALYKQIFGELPRSFRAGRFGLGPHTAEILAENGYFSDSSVTPHLRWESPQGIHSPDYRQSPVSPGFLDTRSGRSLLEIPITILANLEHCASSAPLWFRPSFSSAEELIRIAQDVVQCVSTIDDRPRPLVMMFHSQELIAGASPYCSNERDVAEYLDRLDRCLEACMDLGCLPMTAEELRIEYSDEDPCTPFVLTPHGIDQNQQVQIDEAMFHDSLDHHGVQEWFKYIHRERSTRPDLCVPFTWLSENLAPDAAILATGCGPGLNLHWLAERGFSDLSGLDCDEKALLTGMDLTRAMNRSIRLWKDDGLAPRLLPDRRYDAITALNWTALVDSFELGTFLRNWAPSLAPGGRLILDCIDKAYDEHPKNSWLTWDWNKPEIERRPSEYRRRYSSSEVRCLAQAEGFEVEAVLDLDQEIPKKVYSLRKRKLPRVLLIVDCPDWAHDRKSDALLAHLGDEFDLSKRYNSDLRPSDLDEADLILAFYWRQLSGSPEIVASLERNRDKLVLGICSHAELEGESGAHGIAVLKDYGQALFVHNRMLRDRCRLVFDKPIYYTPNGVDLDFYSPSQNARRPGPLRVGWAGSLENFGRELRGFDLIAEACKTLEGVEFFPAVKEEGQRSADQMLHWYQDLDVYVCASLSEGTPNPCLEAAACGLPIVTTPVGNMPDYLVDGVQGFFIDRRTESIRAALEMLRDDPLLRSRMSLASRDRIQDWSWTGQAENYRQLFRDGLSGLLCQSDCQSDCQTDCQTDCLPV